MGKHWTEVKDEIEREIDKVWFDEPIEVTASRLGIFPSGAGAHGTCIGNLFFLISDNMALGWAMVEPAIYSAIADETFTVEHCKRMFMYLDGCVTKLLGGKNEPECPAAWLNQPKTWKFYCDIVEAFDTIDNKKDLKSLLWSWQNYITRMCRWYHIIFPWDAVGTLAPSRKLEDVQGTLELTEATYELMTKAKQEVD